MTRPVVLCVVLMTLTAPLWATSEEARSSEARAVLGYLKDCLLQKTRDNSGRADTRWTVDDVLTPDGARGIKGSYFTRADYSLRWPDNAATVAVFFCRNVWRGDQGVTDLELEVDLRTGSARFNDPPEPLWPRIVDWGAFAIVTLLTLGVLGLIFRRIALNESKQGTSRAPFAATMFGVWLLFIGALAWPFSYSPDRFAVGYWALGVPIGLALMIIGGQSLPPINDFRLLVNWISSALFGTAAWHGLATSESTREHQMFLSIAGAMLLASLGLLRYLRAQRRGARP
ncbi:hypothetical protein PLCT1_00542 [Planctomycetaceae bacterium]|nr:hypothetical protein PLCT1_00542 [Planctomycetaceae bacterium]